MDYFKSDLLKVLMIFIFIFSFTTGCAIKPSALEICESGLDALFGLDEPLLECVRRAIRLYSNYILPYENEDDKLPQTDDFNLYYWSMYTLVSSVNIEVKEVFCGRIDEFADRITHVDNPNYTDCVGILKSFEVERTKTKGLELQIKILYNALYHHEMRYIKDEDGINMYRAIKFCEDTFKPFFGADSSLLSCVNTAITMFSITVIEPIDSDPYPTFNIWDSLQRSTHPMDIFNYYRKMHTLVSPVNIELKGQFCGRIGAMAEELFEESNPNSGECEETLAIFEIGYSTQYVCEFGFPMSDPSIWSNYPNDYQNSTSNAQNTSPQDYDLKKRILCNVLYHHDLSGHYRKGTYGGAYMKDIASNVGLINGNDYNPRRFCYDVHKNKNS